MSISNCDLCFRVFVFLCSIQFVPAGGGKRRGNGGRKGRGGRRGDRGRKRSGGGAKRRLVLGLKVNGRLIFPLGSFFY